MSTKLKLYLGRKVIESLHKTTKLSPLELQPLIQIGNTDKMELNLPMNLLETQLGVTNVTEILKIQPDDIIRKVQLVRDRANRKISFEIDQNIFMTDVIENGAYPDVNFKPKNVVVEYSSPNVAKPFHFGHLRSTIIGNFISNLNQFLRNKVTRLNYIGNWGTQYGFIQVGLEELGLQPEDIERDPLNSLYRSYVHANGLSEKNPDISKRAKGIFAKLEGGSKEELDRWRKMMGYSKAELVSTYKRLGIEFDEYHYESDYSAKDIAGIVDVLRTKNIIQKDEEGRMAAEIGNRRVAVLKSDGSGLYLTRDIAAAVDRFKRYDFDKMLYVVDNSQSDHFHALRNILYKMDLPWADRIAHVKFGRVKGMSSRKGNALFLRDILDECKGMVLKKQIESPTTKTPLNDERTADILGVSCVIVNDLKRRRQKDYDFDWDKVLQVQGDTGIKLQYAHCRLRNLELNCGAAPASRCQPALLLEPEALLLIKEMAKFHDVLYVASEQLEAYVLVKYLFDLCNHINKAFKTLRVKGTPDELASQRLLLFNTARKVLENGMIILGLTPLNKM
ncbi:unnamed protein product [Phyllotreta striolata]|uniref:Probable arginine--tRNA ligase, mitochondrial n=1 Tax=Phyllotreta striolata TaxID=444603 RepID=A0A9N9TVQ5_PHYSR|nr:unnamed protein product [Phyllotreta striolata]